MPAAPKTGQVTTSGTAQKLSAAVISPTYWSLKAPASNTSTVYFGDATVTTATGYPMEPGDEREFDRRPTAGAVFDLTPNDVYVVGSGGVAAWLALL